LSSSSPEGKESHCHCRHHCFLRRVFNSTLFGLVLGAGSGLPRVLVVVFDIITNANTGVIVITECKEKPFPLFVTTRFLRQCSGFAILFGLVLKLFWPPCGFSRCL
jgi:hypothetical protein